MLLILNCKSIYGTEIPQWASIIKRAGHKIAILGGPGDLERGDIMRAARITLADVRAVAEKEYTDSRKWAILDAAAGFSLENTLLVSDDARDLAAADLLNLRTVSPFDFTMEQLGEST